MAIDLNVEEQQQLAQTFSRSREGMTKRERGVELVVAIGFAATVVVLLVISPPNGLQIEPAAVCTVVMALATMVRFETPYGFTVPTQLAFVPLLFSMPVSLVPIATVLALTIAEVPKLLRGELRPARLVHVPGNAWFSIGPVAVFVIADVKPPDADARILLTALAAQFVCDFLVCTLRDSIREDVSVPALLRETWVYGVDAALSGVGLVVARDLHNSPAAALTLVPLLGILALFARERHQRFAGLVELNNAYRGTALVLGDVVETDDHYTAEHSKGVVGLALAVGARLGLQAEQRRNLEFGALLHDVGKIAIPKQIINKPARLDPVEWTIIKTHSVEGQKLLDRVGGFMREVGLIVRSHHERWDGAGYPDGLAGEGIPLESRIIACCDTWNAMCTDRSYRKALRLDTALAELRRVAGSQLDPHIVDVLLEYLGLTQPAGSSAHSASELTAAQLRARPIAGSWPSWPT
ncbi:MAG: HD-GYP domain-containing protein [Solirubrobacteraceae bacterium]